MQSLISILQSGAELPPADIVGAVERLFSPEIDDNSKAEFLKALRAKGETANEIAAFVEALLTRAIDPGLDPAKLPGPMLDVCGTGGDRMELFNISTTSMFVLSAGGVAVVKHGNRAITSLCGGADVLEVLGVRIDVPPETLRECVETLGLGFIFAPTYHPAFKSIAPVRKMLAAEGIATIFNLLGPLLNPARPPYQFVGIFAQDRLPVYAKALKRLGRTRAWAVHGNGIDELSTSGASEVHEVSSTGIRRFEVHAGQYGIPHAHVGELRGGNKELNARLLVGVLDGSVRGPKRDVVVLNAGAGFVVTGIAPDLQAGLDLAREMLDSGKALAKLKDLQEFSRRS
ncbi:anthranilate phosphoribosyltransferase [Verrucomicrobiota bacterium sgz303538]